MYDQALAELREASHDPNFAGQAHTQLALCFRAMGRHNDAVAELRQALNSPSLSSKEYLHVLYLLGENLESLGRYAEALETYGWVRQEDAEFLDVQSRIKHLCALGCGTRQSVFARPLRAGDLLHLWQSLLGRLVRPSQA